MTGFLETGWPYSLIAISEILQVVPAPKDKDGNDWFTAILRDGSKVRLSVYERQKLALHPMQIMPAEAGISVIRVDGTEAGPQAYRGRLTGWALCMDGTIRPVTPEGVDENVENHTWVELPNGEIAAADNFTEPCSFKDAAAMVEHFRAVRSHSSNPDAPFRRPAFEDKSQAAVGGDGEVANDDKPE